MPMPARAELVRRLLSNVCVATLLLASTSALASGPAMLFEPATGTVLFAEEPDLAWHPASITKLMTVYLAFEDVKAGKVGWDDEVPLSTYARSQPATRIGLRAGIRLKLSEALGGLVLRSANDFAVAIAEKIGGDEGSFVSRMNATARRLGMTRTRFTNPHGLPNDDQVTTARDMALLTMALIKDFPDRIGLFSTTSIRIHRGTFHSSNDLLRTFEGADGMKTGFTCGSGYNVVASATRNGRRLAAIVFGAANRNERSARSKELLEQGFAFFAARDKAAPAAATGPPVAQPAAAGIAAANKGASKTAASGEASAPAPATVPAPDFKPVALKDMAMSPADPAPPHDAALDTRMRKCPGSGRSRGHRKEIARKPHPSGAPAVSVMTGSVLPRRASGKVVRAIPKRPAEGDGK
jgi:D-alanyl-D-alanine carboxypeptidase